jgi:hypothetical protein
MTKRITKPEQAFSVTTYDELHRFVRAFADGHLNLLILIGSAGIAKSQSVRRAVGDGACWLEGNATAFGIYTQLYKHRGDLVVIDDVDSLYTDRSAVRLLKCLCQTDPEKNVAWHTAAAGTDEIPRQFQTSSRVVIIANDWKTLDQNVAAVQDRGHLVIFEPSAEEVHRQVAEWFDDQNIYDWFADHLHLLPNPSMRNYVRAAELQASGINWVQHLLAEVPATTRLVAELRANANYATENDRIEAFRERGGGSRATYFNHKKRLRRAGEGTSPSLRIPLKHPREAPISKAA